MRGLETRRIAGLQGTVSTRRTIAARRAIRTATDLLRLTRPAVASGNERRVKAMWDVASDAGLRTAIVNWWATWPAPDGNGSGTVLSDRATLRLEHGGPLDAEIAPASINEALRARWPAIRRDASAQARAAAAAGVGRPTFAPCSNDPAELDAIQLALAHEVSNPHRI